MFFHENHFRSSRAYVLASPFQLKLETSSFARLLPTILLSTFSGFGNFDRARTSDVVNVCGRKYCADSIILANAMAIDRRRKFQRRHLTRRLRPQPNGRQSRLAPWENRGRVPPPTKTKVPRSRLHSLRMLAFPSTLGIFSQSALVALIPTRIQPFA